MSTLTSTSPRNDSIDVSNIAVDAIHVGKRHRVAADVTELAASIERSGLLHPIVVRPRGESDYTLVAGANRLEAHRKLERFTVPAIVRDYDDIEAELAEIDENLTTNTLTVLEQGEHLVRRSEILRELGLRAHVGDNQHTDVGGPATVTGPPSEQVTDNAPRPVTTRDLAEQIGVSDRSVRRYVEIASELPVTVRDLIRGSEVANRTTDLLTLAGMKDEEQREVAGYLNEHKRAGVAAARHALYEADDQAEDDEPSDDPGHDIGERYDVVGCEGTLTWKRASNTMRKRIINGEERFYPRESQRSEYVFEFLIGVEAFEADGRRFLCNSIARQLYGDEGFVWPPA